MCEELHAVLVCLSQNGRLQLSLPPSSATVTSVSRHLTHCTYSRRRALSFLYQTRQAACLCLFLFILIGQWHIYEWVEKALAYGSKFQGAAVYQQQHHSLLTTTRYKVYSA